MDNYFTGTSQEKKDYRKDTRRIKMGKLRWKKKPRETGLRAIGAGPQGSYLHDGETKYATVNALGGDWRRDLIGWYFVAGWGSKVPHKNTCNNPVPTEDEAKRDAYKYVTRNLVLIPQFEAEEGRNEQ